MESDDNRDAQDGSRCSGRLTERTLIASRHIEVDIDRYFHGAGAGRSLEATNDRSRVNNYRLKSTRLMNVGHIERQTNSSGGCISITLEDASRSAQSADGLTSSVGQRQGSCPLGDISSMGRSYLMRPVD